MRKVALAGLFALGFLVAGGFSAAVVIADTGTTTTGTTSTETSTTTTTTTTVPPPRQLPPGVRIAGVFVGGLPSDAAYSVLLESFEQPLTLVVARHTLRPTPDQLGATAYLHGALARALAAAPNSSVDLVVTVRGSKVRAYVAGLAKRFDRKPTDAKLSLRGLAPFVSKDVPGAELDRPRAIERIVAALRTNDRDPLKLRQKLLPAKVTRGGFGPVIVIHRGSNRLQLYHGMRQWRTFGIATGQRIYPTPLGRFQIVVMWKNPWWYPPASPWAVGEKPTPPGPGNPLGTRWMGLSAPGIGMHGTPDAASIGYSASHGCIRMHIPDAEWLFDHVAIGTTVYIVSA